VAIVSLVLLAAMGGVAIEYSKIAAERREAAASIWLRRMETALPSEVASLIRERNPSDPIVSETPRGDVRL